MSGVCCCIIVIYDGFGLKKPFFDFLGIIFLYFEGLRDLLRGVQERHHEIFLYGYPLIYNMFMLFNNFF